MSSATGIPSAASEPDRRAGLAYFFVRLVKEKPLGTACGILILILIIVLSLPMFWLPIHIGKSTP